MGIDFHPLAEGPEEAWRTQPHSQAMMDSMSWFSKVVNDNSVHFQDALRMAAQQDHQAIFALSLTCSHLAQDAVETCADQVLFIRNEESAVRSCSQFLSFNLKSVYNL